MNDTPEFSSIFSMSKKLEIERLDRELSTVMRDEYKLNDEINHLLDTGTYQFPDVLHSQTDKRILTRVQDNFSAKIHIKRIPLYFHQHDFIEILYVYKGSCKQYIDNLSNCIILQEGDIFLLNQNFIHAIMQEDEQAILIKIDLPTDILSYEFIQKLNHKSDLFEFFVEAKAPQNKYYHYLHYTGCTTNEKSLIEKIMTEYYMQYAYSEEAITCYLQLLMILLERNSNPHHSYRYKLTHNSIPAGEIVQYIYEHSETVTLEELSRVFSFNQTYLSRIIKENCKMNFQNLVRESRLEKVASLLSSSDYSVDKIAQIVGYQNATPVYQGIKEKFGCSPAEYRKRYGKIKIEDSINE